MACAPLCCSDFPQGVEKCKEKETSPCTCPYEVRAGRVQPICHLEACPGQWFFWILPPFWDLLQKGSDKYVTRADGPGNCLSFQPTSLLKQTEKVDVVLLAESSMSRLGMMTSKPQLALRWVTVRCTEAAVAISCLLIFFFLHTKERSLREGSIQHPLILLVSLQCCRSTGVVWLLFAAKQVKLFWTCCV